MDKAIRIGGILLLLALFVPAGGCGDDENGQNAYTFTSSTVANHNHTVTINDDQIGSGQALTLVTSSDAGHTHTLALTAAQVADFDGGDLVMINTSIEDEHSHEFSMVKTSQQ